MLRLVCEKWRDTRPKALRRRPVAPVDCATRKGSRQGATVRTRAGDGYATDPLLLRARRKATKNRSGSLRSGKARWGSNGNAVREDPIRAPDSAAAPATVSGERPCVKPLSATACGQMRLGRGKVELRPASQETSRNGKLIPVVGWTTSGERHDQFYRFRRSGFRRS